MKKYFNWIFFALVCLIYIVLYFLNPHATMQALTEAFSILKTIAPVIAIVYILMTILNKFIKPKTLQKHLSKLKGTKGWLIALFAGVLSHGSSYMWYPLIQSFRENGIKDGFVVAFLYARAIKIPWLALMVSYFGITFTILLSLYIVLGAFIQGLIVNKLTKSKY